MNRFPPGLYDLLKTSSLSKRLEEAGLTGRARWLALDGAELASRFVQAAARELGASLAGTFEIRDDKELLSKLENKIKDSGFVGDFLRELILEDRATLHQIAADHLEAEIVRPDTSLALSALLTGSSRSPALRIQLQKELSSCDRADWLVSFIKYSGILPLLASLTQFTQAPAADGGPRLRIATTSYMGATDAKAIETLLDLPNTEIRISYDSRRTRLHAKAYLFHRATGFSSAYIGSANISRAALDEGLEWTAKISQYENGALWKQACATFESHWEDATEFTPCKKSDMPRLRQALLHEAKAEALTASAFFDLRPYDYQRVILQDIAAEREAGKTKHLIIAATGTGKTMIAAFDYKAFCEIHRVDHDYFLLLIGRRF